MGNGQIVEKMENRQMNLTHDQALFYSTPSHWPEKLKIIEPSTIYWYQPFPLARNTKNNVNP
jgi:hypothetical protein